MSDTVVLIGLQDILKKTRNIRVNVASKEAMEEVGTFLIFRIQSRTSAGKDVNDRNFKPYTPQYKLFRESTGHPGKVNLFFSGSMMSSMTQSAQKNKVKIFFMNTSDPSGTSNPLKAYFLNQDRRFFAINKTDKQKALAIIQRHIKETILSRR